MYTASQGLANPHAFSLVGLIPGGFIGVPPNETDRDCHPSVLADRTGDLYANWRGLAAGMV